MEFILEYKKWNGQCTLLGGGGGGIKILYKAYRYDVYRTCWNKIFPYDVTSKVTFITTLLLGHHTHQSPTLLSCHILNALW
jgi:hypothetical protein